MVEEGVVLLEAVEAGLALRPDEGAACVEDEGPLPARGADGGVDGEKVTRTDYQGPDRGGEDDVVDLSANELEGKAF